MEKPIHIDEELIAKFLSGDASPSEAIIVNDWIDSSAENKLRYKEYEKIWLLDSTKHDLIINKTESWRALQSKVKREEGRAIFFTPYKIAASILLIVLAAWAVYLLKPISNPPIISWTTKQTTNEVASLNLSDGTSVTMNRNTKLSWPNQYSSTTRDVKLEGEAYFDVTHDESKPFIISTDEIKIKVLGTSFNVWLDKKHDEIKADVTRGKVMMYNSEKNIIIEAGMVGIYNKSTKEFSLLKMKNKNTIGYVTHSLSFTNSTMDQVSGELSKAYGVKFIFENEKLKDCRLTTEYQNKSLSFILNVIEESLNIKYHVQGDSVYVSGDGCL